jgi:uncharacterized phage protein gp47/JayE
MQLPLQTFTGLVQNMAAAAQTAASRLLDLTVGSTLRAILEASASVALWLQWLNLQVLQSTRAATSTGPDLDSWMADFTLVRLPAVAATGTVTFARYTPTLPAIVPYGALVRTSDGTQSFSVSMDTTNSAWNQSANGYSLPAGAASATVPVTAQVPGSAGNVQAGAVTMLAAAMPGIDTVVNAAPFRNGVDAETDAALRARFQNFIQSRSRATRLAIGYAVTSVQQGLQYSIQENASPTGATVMGSFVVTIDDGSGYPSSALLATVQTAVDAVRPIGSVFAVQAPTVFIASASLTLSVASTASKPSLASQASAAITSFVNSLAIGAPLPLTKLAQIVYGVDPGVVNVSQLEINGVSADLVPPLNGVVKAGTVTVN